MDITKMTPDELQTLATAISKELEDRYNQKIDKAYDKMTIEELKDISIKVEKYLKERYIQLEEMAANKIAQIVRDYCEKTEQDYLRLFCKDENDDKYIADIHVNSDGSFYVEC